MTQQEYKELEAKCTRYLGSYSGRAFINFMANVDLGSARLVKWADAFKSSNPVKIPPAGNTLYATTILKWLKELYSASELSNRKARMEALKANKHFQYSVCQYNLIRESNSPPVGSLIIVFEHKTETLVHHLIKKLATSDAIWYVINEAHQQALRKMGPKGKELKHFVIRQPDIEKIKTLQADVAHNTHWILGNSVEGRLGDQSEKSELKKLALKWGRQKFEIVPQHWEPRTFSCAVLDSEWNIGKQDYQTIHKKLLLTAANVTKHFQKQPKHPQFWIVTPSWTCLSRARQ